MFSKKGKNDNKKDKAIKKSKWRKSKNKDNKKPKKQKKKKNRNRDKDKYKIMGGLFGDRASSTLEGVVKGILFVVFVGCIVVGCGKMPFDHADMTKYSMGNTTPIGEQLEFSKSGAEVTIKDVWTDKKRDLTVVKLGYDKSARRKLSTTGKNYHLHMIADEGHKPKVSVKYGVLGTEGDGYLFIKGNLDRRAYQMVIANTLNLSTGDEGVTGETSSSNYNDENLEKAISNTDIEQANDKGMLFSGGNINKEDQPKADNIDFRVNPYSKTTHVYKGSFLNADGSINYGKVVEQTSVKDVMEKLDKDIKKSKGKLDSLKQSKKEFESRVKDDKKNSEAKSNLDQTKDSIKEEEKNLKALEEAKERYEKSDFDESSFGDMQDKIKVHTQ